MSSKMLNLKNILIVRGVSIERFARDMNVASTVTRKWIDGAVKPTWRTIRKMSHVLYASEAALYCDQDLWYEWCLIEYRRPEWDSEWSNKKKEYWNPPTAISRKLLEETVL